MTTLELKVAQRKKAFLKLGISAPSGGGKTLGALLIGFGLMKGKYPQLPESELWRKIAIIDTENGSGQLYVGSEVAGVRVGEYNAVTLTPPFEATKYTQAIKLCADAGMEVAIIDSSTHLWSGEGGLLEKQQAIAKRTTNSYTAWREITPEHNVFVNTLLQTPMHIIATMRAKQEYVQEKGQDGKTTVRKLGMEPEQRKGMEYEFTVFLEVNAEHEAFGAKDRTSILDQRTFKITPDVGVTLMKWLESGVDENSPTQVLSVSSAEAVVPLETLKSEVIELMKRGGGTKNVEMMKLVESVLRVKNPNSCKDPMLLKEVKGKLEDMILSPVQVFEQESVTA